jgi:hypothetical protein
VEVLDGELGSGQRHGVASEALSYATHRRFTTAEDWIGGLDELQHPREQKRCRDGRVRDASELRTEFNGAHPLGRSPGATGQIQQQGDQEPR